MLKRFLALLGACTLLFCSPAFANEIKETKVDSSSSKETLAIMESQLGTTKLMSIGVPGYDNINRAVIRWYTTPQTFIPDLQPGSTAQGLMLCIDVTDNTITQNNIVRFNLPSSYGNFNFANLFTRAGTYENVEIEGNTVTVYNPHWSGDNSVMYDVCIGVPFVNGYTNNSDSVMQMLLNGSFNNLSSGTELLDTLVSYFTVNQVVVILASTAAACVGLVFMWWGVRKMGYAIMSAFRKGKLRI